MDLKRFVLMALGALGLGALVSGPASAQIPIPDVLGDQAAACMTPTVTATMPADLPGAIVPLSLTNASCTEVNKDITEFRSAYDAVVAAQTALDMHVDDISGTPTAVQQQTTDFLTRRLQEAQSRKNMYNDDPLAAAVYAEKDAIANFAEAHEAVNDGAGGTQAALNAAQMRYENYPHTYDDEDGDSQTKTISEITTDLETAQATWRARAYGSDGDLLETIPDTALDAAERIANLKEALDAAEAAATAEKLALDNAKARDDQADAALKSAADAVTSTMRGVVNNVKGAGDSIDTRIAERVRVTRRAFTDAEEDLTEAQDDLAEAQGELRDAQRELADAQGDYDDARTAYDNLIAQDDPDADDLQAAEIAVADAARQVVRAELDVTTARTDVQTATRSINRADEGFQAVRDAARAALDKALAAQSGTYNFEDGNPVEALAEELLKDPEDDATDQGGVLVDALDETWDNTQDNKARLDSILTPADEDAGIDESGRIVEIEKRIDELFGADPGDGNGDGEDPTVGLVAGLQSEIDALAAEDDPTTPDVDEGTGRVTVLEDLIHDEGGLDNRIAENERDIINLLGVEDNPDTDVDESAPGLVAEGDKANADAIAALTAGADTEDTADDGAVTANSKALVALEKKVVADDNILEERLGGRIEAIQGELLIDNEGAGTGEGGLSRLDDIEAKLGAKKEYIENLDTAIGFNSATNEGTVELADGTMGSRIDKNAEDIVAGDNVVRDEFAAADTVLGGRIDIEIEDRTAADNALGDRIDTEVEDRTAADNALGGRIDTEIEDRTAADDSIRTDFAAADTAEREARVAADDSIRTDFAAADMSIRADFAAADTGLRNMINDNRNMIGELSDDLDVVRAGVAASMALAGMPAINGRGISIGVGSFDGESAFAVGFQLQGEQASFKVGVTSSGGATGASAGVGFNF